MKSLYEWPILLLFALGGLILGTLEGIYYAVKGQGLPARLKPRYRYNNLTTSWDKL